MITVFTKQVLDTWCVGVLDKRITKKSIIFFLPVFFLVLPNHFYGDNYYTGKRGAEINLNVYFGSNKDDDAMLENISWNDYHHPSWSDEIEFGKKCWIDDYVKIFETFYEV